MSSSRVSFPSVRVHHKSGTVGRHPDEVIAEPKHILDLRLPLQDAEVGVALSLDRHGLHLGIEAFVDPDAAEFQHITALHLPIRCPFDTRLTAQVRRLDRQIHAELAGLHLLGSALAELSCRFVEGGLLVFGVSPASLVVALGQLTIFVAAPLLGQFARLGLILPRVLEYRQRRLLFSPRNKPGAAAASGRGRGPPGPATGATPSGTMSHEV